MQHHPTCLLLCVNYRLPELTAQFVRHATSLSDAVSVAVCDNDGSLDAAAVDHPRVQRYVHPQNPGYLGGCALALDEWRKAHGELPEWIGVVNTDIEFAPDFFSRLRELALPEDTASLAPDIRLPNGTPQNPFMATRPERGQLERYARIFRSDLLFAFWECGHHAKRGVAQFKSHTKPSHDATEQESTRTIYAPYGAAMFLRNTFFARGGSLHYRAFMYQEEIFIAEQLRKMSLSCLYTPQLKLTHCENTVMRLMGLRKRRQWKLESARVILDDYFTTDAIR